MMKSKMAHVVLFLFLFFQYSTAEEAIATITKVRGIVQIKEVAQATFNDAKAGQSIFTGDVLKVGDPGFCMVIFLDDKSILKIRESTEFQFVDTENTRTLDIEFGKILSDIKKERKKDFRIETPVSVASVKGTEFWTVSQDGTYDKFYGVEGTVEVFNVVSGQTVSLGPGQMTMSTATGQILTVPASPEEYPEDPEAKVEEEIKEVPEEEIEEEVEEEVIEEEEVEEVPEEEVPEEALEAEEVLVPEEAEVPPAEEEAPEEEPTPEAARPFNMGLGFGSVTIDGVLYNQLALRPELSFGKLGIGLDVVLYIDPQGKIRRNEWDEPTDFFDKILFVRWGQRGDPFFAKYGAMENMTLGYGGLIYGYSNMMEFPQVRRIGLNAGVQFGSIGTEVFIANFKDFARTGGLVGSRLTYTLGKKLTLGGNVVVDINQYAGLKDFDDDGVPDLLDDFPQDKDFTVDTDGDGISDSIDPDRDGDGYTDNSQRPDVENNDPDGVILKPDPFNVKEVGARTALGFAFDIGYPVLRSKVVNIDLYAEANLLQFENERNGTGLVPIGVKLGLFKFLNLYFQYRMDSDFYTPWFFDQAYDLDRVAIEKDETGALVVRTKDERIFTDEPGQRQGFYGGASVSILNLVSGSASYTDMRSETDTLRSFTASINLNTDNIPKISQAFAYYQRNNDPNPFDFTNPSSNTIMGYRIGYELSPGVSLVWDYRQLYQDLNGNGEIEDDAGEVINITTIETQFSF